MKRTHLPLNALRVFDAAARHLSFTRAADELAVTPAAVGQQIRALEDMLGVVLFRRTPKGLELTGEANAGLDALRQGFLQGRCHARCGGTAQVSEPAGTYSRAILGRLLIDLSWASSHLEGARQRQRHAHRLARMPGR